MAAAATQADHSGSTANARLLHSPPVHAKQPSHLSLPLSRGLLPASPAAGAAAACALLGGSRGVAELWRLLQRPALATLCGAAQLRQLAGVWLVCCGGCALVAAALVLRRRWCAWCDAHAAASAWRFAFGALLHQSIHLPASSRQASPSRLPPTHLACFAPALPRSPAPLSSSPASGTRTKRWQL